MRLGWRAQAEPVDVLMVCTGNFCRSPMAEAILQEAVKGRLEVASAGTLGVREPRPHPHVMTMLKRAGTSLATLERLKPRRLRPQMVVGATLILTAEREHRVDVVAMDPTSADRVFTVKEFARLVADAHPTGVDARARLGELVAHAGDALHRDWHDEEREDDLADPLNEPLSAFEDCYQQLMAALAWSALVVAQPHDDSAGG